MKSHSGLPKGCLAFTLPLPLALRLGSVHVRRGSKSQGFSNHRVEWVIVVERKSSVVARELKEKSTLSFRLSDFHRSLSSAL